MTIHIHWTLDVAADRARAEPALRRPIAAVARDVRPATINRYDHYAQIARAAAQAHFDGLFVPHRVESDDSQIVAAAIARAAPGLLLIPQFPASVGSAVYAAKQAVSFQRLAHERLAWAIAPDADRETRIRGTDHLADEDLIARTDEFLTVARGVHGTRPFDFKGRFFEVQGGGFEDPLSKAPFPIVFLGGTSEEALALSARHADVHLFDAAPATALRPTIETLDRLALDQGRTIGFGLIQPVVARETAAEAEAAAAPANAIVGSFDDVAARLAELAEIGIEHLILSATPSLEEAYRVGQHVLPRLRALTAQQRAAA